MLTKRQKYYYKLSITLQAGNSQAVQTTKEKSNYFRPLKFFMPINTVRFITTEGSIKVHAPDAKGVYALYTKESALIYYGMSNSSIRKKLLSHYKGDEGSCTSEAWYFNFELTSEPGQREKELLEEYKYKNSVLPQCNKEAA